MLEKIFANYGMVRKAEEEVESKGREIKGLERQVEYYKGQLETLRRDTARRDEQSEYENGRTITRLEETIQDLEGKLKVAKAEARKEAEAEVAAEHQSELEEANARVRDAEIEAEDASRSADHRILMAEAKAEKSIETARINIRKEFEVELDEAKDATATANERAAKAEGENEALETVIEGLESQVAGYEEFAKFVMTKLPNVDLSKFNIQVNVPAQEVVVNAGGNQKGGKEEGKKQG